MPRAIEYQHDAFSGTVQAVWMRYAVREPIPLKRLGDSEYVRTATQRVGISLVAYWRNRKIVGQSDTHSEAEAKAEFEKALEAAYEEELAKVNQSDKST